jgi:hypothetical protein
MKLSKSQQHVAIAFSTVVFLILVGAFFYYGNQSLSWVNSFYVTIMTVMTIGVNGFAPTTDAAKIFTMIYTLISVPTLIFCLGAIVEDRFASRIQRIEEHRERRKNDE